MYICLLYGVGFRHCLDLISIVSDSYIIRSVQQLIGTPAFWFLEKPVSNKAVQLRCPITLYNKAVLYECLLVVDFCVQNSR